MEKIEGNTLLMFHAYRFVQTEDFKKINKRNQIKCGVEPTVTGSGEMFGVFSVFIRPPGADSQPPLRVGCVHPGPGCGRVCAAPRAAVRRPHLGRCGSSRRGSTPDSAPKGGALLNPARLDHGERPW